MNSRSRFPQTNDLANHPLQPLGYSSVFFEHSFELVLLFSAEFGDSHLGTPPRRRSLSVLVSEQVRKLSPIVTPPLNFANSRRLGLRNC